ncbi:MAG: FkbM family methyltransferase [Rhizobiales bacterium]|nr:FkbM family methyltransferase [Hyphomicrobiales bacterium]
MTEFSLRMSDGTHIVLPPSLSAITTYVLLEQEQWFEKETQFLARWLKRGMNVIDIGANLGVYSLPAARMAGPTGQVYAYEPASETRRMLEAGKRKNRSINLNVIAAALSDSERDGKLFLGTSSELNTLEGSGDGEAIRISSLDAEQAARNWGRIDFLKIDAEGEELRILDGAKSFFASQSPLVMFEVKAGERINEELRAAFVALGFRLYRQLGGAAILVPVAPDAALDGYEINLFAIRPEQAAELAKDGLLADAIADWTPDEVARAKALDLIKTQAFAPTFAQLIGAPLDETYREALAGYAVWRGAEGSLSERVGALRFACDKLQALCDTLPSLARLSTLARVSSDFGCRSVSANALQSLTGMLKDGTGRMEEAFWPASARFDKIAPGAHVMEWFVVSALEQFERTAFFSSTFGNSGVDLDWLVRQPFVSAEMERRRILKYAQAGRTMDVPKRLMTSGPDHINSDKWRAGQVPNTVAKR